MRPHEYGDASVGKGVTVTYQPAQRALQEHFDTRRLADRLETGTSDSIGAAHQAFIEARELFFLATADADGWPQCSYKGGAPGFVRVLDEHTLAFPLYDGNGMFLSAGNIDATSKVGLLFVDLEGGSRLRLNGEATVAADDPLIADYPGAKLVVRVRARQVFANCRRYVHRYELVEPSPFVPSADGEAPVPDWKRHPWFDGTLPAGDPANDPDHPDAPSTPEF
jgi:predicted pyridoxine 5'-phosphate oxidase superfamily flavin-nucleotide-binding protein